MSFARRVVLDTGVLVSAAIRPDSIPALADFEVMPQPPHPLRWLPDAQALADSIRALKEYLGLWVYRWRGWAE